LSYAVVPARLKDVKTLHELEKKVFTSDAWPLIDLLSLFVIPGSLQLKAITGNRIIGFIAAEESFLEKHATITTVGVDPDFRRMGVASALMDNMEQRIRRNIIRLCVRVSNHGAITLYESLGYQQRSTRKRYYSDGENAIEMEKTR
jgi:ribosomal-protein-alanine N-acetyltransferase